MDEETHARTEKVADRMVPDYLEWVQRDIEKFAEALHQLNMACQDQPGPGSKASGGDGRTACPDRLPHVSALYDLAHTMKGQGGSFGYDLMTDIGDLICAHIDEIKTVMLEDCQLFDLCLDAMRVVIGERMTDGGGADGQAILNGLSKAAREALAARDGAAAAGP